MMILFMLDERKAITNKRERTSTFGVESDGERGDDGAFQFPHEQGVCL
jgi:hypothetical protein